MHDIRIRRGVSLIEMLVVLSILVALAAITIPRYDGLTRDAQITTTRQTLSQLQELIVNRYVNDMTDVVASSNTAVAKGLPGPHAGNLVPSSRQQWPQLVFLFVNPFTNDISNTFNPLSARGWRGPYLISGRGGAYPGNDPTTAVARGFTDQYGLNATQGANGIADQAVLDAWGNPIVVTLDPSFTQVGASPIAYYQLQSAGPDGTLNTSDDLTLPLR